MKTKFQFGLVIGMIAFVSTQALAEETHSWVNFDTAVAGSAAGGSIAILSSAAKTVSIRMEGTAYSSEIPSSASMKEKLIRPLVEEKTKLEKELVDSQKRYEQSHARLQRQIEASQMIAKIAPGQIDTNRKSGLSYTVERAFKDTELYQQDRYHIKKKIDSLDKRIAAIPQNLESKTYSIYLTAGDTERIENIRPAYNYFKLREKEAEKILKRSRKIASIAKIGNSAALPVAIGTMMATAYVSNNMRKAKAETSNSGSSQNETAPVATTPSSTANQSAQ